MHRPKYISLFSGAMGLDIGLERAGLIPIICNEIDPLAIKTIKLNRPNLPLIEKSITEITLQNFEEAAKTSLQGIDLIAGGPPCQAFSVFGQRRGILDGRGQMISEFFRLIKEANPKVFLMENVRGLHSMPLIPKRSDVPKERKINPEHLKSGSLLREIFKKFEGIGYHIDCFIVNAVNYGAPQIRERLICIGNRFNLEANFPNPMYSNRHTDNLPPFKTLGDVIGNGFKDPDPSVMNFSPRKLKYLAMIPPGGNWRSMPIDIQKESMGKSWYLKGGRSAYWRRLSMDYPSPTVVTMPNHAGTSMCHPSELRALTVGELAAIQEFPRNWEFAGTATDKCRQIGNAVPPRLGEVAGNVILKLLQKIGNSINVEGIQPHASRITHIRPHVRTRSYFKNGKVLNGVNSYYSEKEIHQVQLNLSQ